jgi:zinc D-Ala-D-Ala carboxypeptidase
MLYANGNFNRTAYSLGMRILRTAVVTVLMISWGNSVAKAQIDSVSYLLGKFNPSAHPEFVQVPLSMGSQSGMYLRKEVLEAFTRMRQAAAKDGIMLTIISATRNFDRQKTIWEAKWTGTRKVDGQDLSITMEDPAARARKILHYSSMPGTSRHHWGTDLDINSLSPAHYRSGIGKKTYDWMVANAAGFGFCQSYTAKWDERPHGYEEEAWHWSYAPVSCQLLRSYKRLVNASHLTGFKGSDALPFALVMQYVEGVSKDCISME